MFTKEDFYSSGFDDIDDFIAEMIKEQFIEHIGDNDALANASMSFELSKSGREIEMQSEMSGNLSTIITSLILLCLKEKKMRHIFKSVAIMLTTMDEIKSEIQGDSNIMDNLN